VSKAVLGRIPLMQGGGEDAIIQRWKQIADAAPRWRGAIAWFTLKLRRWPRLAATAASLDDFRRDAGL
jgi:hypothetical protein